MANTYCGLGTQINNDDPVILPDDELDYFESDEDYDALNDETFGALEDSSNLDDWEQQHETFAKIAESRKQTDQIENSLSRLVLDDSDDLSSVNKESIWSFEDSKNGDSVLNSAIFSNLQKASKSLGDSNSNSKKDPSDIINKTLSHIPFPPSITPSISKKVISVEELERGLIKNNVKLPQTSTSSHSHHPLPPQASQLPPPPHLPPPQNGSSFPHPLFQHNLPNRPPPGLPHPAMPPHVHPHLHLIASRPNIPNPLLHMVPPPPPHFLQGNQVPAPGLLYPGSSQFPVNHPYNFPPPPRNVNAHGYPHQVGRGGQGYYSRHKSDMNHNLRHHKNGGQTSHPPLSQQQQQQSMSAKDAVHDEYAGLMSSREKQWLLNIQMLQLNTGTPYFDDYYYTIFKERKAKNNKDNQPTSEKIQRHRRNSERQDSQNHLTPKVYTPLQFENSLGKLQCGSVTAPRKIIDMDVVSLDKDSETGSATSSRDTRKTKQLLLELEALYSLLLKVEDLRNPLYHTNMEKLVELKQKQRLRELEVATTSEQKQEILKLLQRESVVAIENQQDYLMKVANTLCSDEKFPNFLAIRKGKMLLLRLLPYLGTETFATQLSELWTKVLLSIPAVGRRDTAGDNLLPKLYPYFKRYVQTCDMSNILDMLANVTEVVKLDSSRSTPLSQQGKSPLNYIVSNKFGVSALSTLLVRTEYLILSDGVTDRQRSEWAAFVLSWCDAVSACGNVATPIEPIPLPVFTKHTHRIESLTPNKSSLLKKNFVDSD